MSNPEFSLDMPLKERQEKFMQMSDENIDYSDIPPLDDEFFKNAINDVLLTYVKHQSQ